MLSLTTTFSQLPPKREFRAAWLATVTNLDWPSTPGLDPATQRSQLVTLLDQLKSAGINAVIFQVRPECDALYNSPYEPWSYFLTGQQGLAPNPPYDPLQFAVEEAHKRGMELHAWFNPYRAVRKVSGSGSYAAAATHVSVLHPDWILYFPTTSLKILNPGLPEVREFVARVVADIVRRYDVDGVHADDYFYPYDPIISNEDASTFQNYSRGFTNLGDWRRDNVNLLMKMIRDSVQTIKPFVKIGMSPFGIWKNGVPPGITGLDAYSSIYGDAIAWLHDHSVDYLTPQLYWVIGGPQDYSKLVSWWADSTRIYGRHLYPGQAAYRISDNNWAATELPSQIRLNRANGNAMGSVFFRAAQGVTNNPKGLADSLRNNYYKYPSLLPTMAWKDTVPPYMPRAIRYAPLASSGAPAIQWDLPLPASDGDTASRYAVYRFDHPPVLPGEFADARNIIAIEPARYSMPPAPPGAGPYYYYATALDRNFNESDTSNGVMVRRPDAPILASPVNGAGALPGSVTLRWHAPGVVSGYRVQVGTDSLFGTGIIANTSGLVDTFMTVTDLAGQQGYFWRVSASNAGGTSDYSSVSKFTVGVPAAPVPVLPANLATDVPVNVRFAWRADNATVYRFQLSTGVNFTTLLVDSSGLVDTTVVVSGLEVSRIHFWRVMASNIIGTSVWSEVWRFRTALTGIEERPELPVSYELSQNYPNPFNPTTTIRYAIPQAGRVTIRVYDVLGGEVATLVDEIQSPGRYTVTWNGAESVGSLRSVVASGVYFYRIVAGGFTETRRMLFIK